MQFFLFLFRTLLLCARACVAYAAMCVCSRWYNTAVNSRQYIRRPPLLVPRACPGHEQAQGRILLSSITLQSKGKGRSSQLKCPRLSFGTRKTLKNFCKAKSGRAGRTFHGIAFVTGSLVRLGRAARGQSHQSRRVPERWPYPAYRKNSEKPS